MKIKLINNESCLTILRGVLLVIIVSMLHLSACTTAETAIEPVSTVDSATTLKVARSVKRGYFGGSIGSGVGDSMKPFYGEHTVMVITPAEFNDLQAGMMVAYQNMKGKRIVHQLVRKRGKKWIAQGLNNQVMDEEWVIADNFLGVVYAVFNSRSLDN